MWNQAWMTGCLGVTVFDELRIVTRCSHEVLRKVAQPPIRSLNSGIAAFGDDLDSMQGHFAIFSPLCGRERSLSVRSIFRPFTRSAASFGANTKGHPSLLVRAELK